MFLSYSRVDLKLFVHYRDTKALLKTELQDQDIVFTTYGTLMSEFLSKAHSPLVETKWLRICLDEGHIIKNYRAKTAKAVANLDTERKWIISGTPIQNNLNELWSLLAYLGVEPYASDRKLFKEHIDYPIKRNHAFAMQVISSLYQSL